MAAPKRVSLLLVLLALAAAWSGEARAQQQFQGLCARVKIEILQELTLERIGFLATLEITNNEIDADITGFSARLSFEDPELSVADRINDSSGLFFVQPPDLDGVTGLDGTGLIPAGKTARIEWFIIPKVTAGGTEVTGVRYRVGVQLAGSIYGKEIDPSVLLVIPDTIVVRPEPQLEITYFQPRDVTGDDPFTPEVESPIPFTLGVLVKNSGFGLARRIKIRSEQPRIVENKQGLLMVPRLLGSRVDDQGTDETSLTVRLGDIEPGRCRKGAWDMITTLSGEFVEFRASYTHASELGGEETSVIRSINAYFISREVLNDQPGRDQLLDFLADTDNDPEQVPDALYESDCNVLPVNELKSFTVSSQGAAAVVKVNADREGWVYLRTADPGQARLRIARVARSDGKVLNPRNYWTNVRYSRQTNERQPFLNLFDFVQLGDYEYRVEYASPPADTAPPETRLRFSGPSRESAGKHYVLPTTMVFFTVEDASPVSTSYRLDGAGDFEPALPFAIEADGEHLLEYFSVDRANNREAVKSAAIVVSADPPAIVDYSLDEEEIFSTGGALSIRPRSLRMDFQGSFTSSTLDAEVEVFEGVLGWPAVAGVPSSPTASRSASLAVGGENVDFYRYRVGSGPWSAEAPASEPLELGSLPNGPVTVSVNGRSLHGDYLPESEAVAVSWVVDPAAPPTAIGGVPPTPSRSGSATLQVSGADQYRYSLDGGFFHAPAPATEPILLHGLSEADHTVRVIGQVGAQPWQEEARATRVSFRVDRSYGFDLSRLRLVRREVLPGVADGEVSFEWDGKDGTGVVAPPGWYTVRLTLIDELERATRAVRLVRVGDLAAEGSVLSLAGKSPRASGRWAVWQDQANGNWDIFARDLLGGGPSLAVATGPLNQEKPATDGRYAVWEDRQVDGSWDLGARELGSADPAFPVTRTPDLDERNPALHWPWIVYQSRPASGSGPWQLKVQNLESGQTAALDPTTQDQLHPAIHGAKVAWQDLRDPGAGEIYLKDLQSGEVRRLTNDLFGQFQPAVEANWVVWSDSRHTKLELYGYNQNGGSVTRLTETPENETRPVLYGKWVVYEEDSAGVLVNNLRALSLTNLLSVQLTNRSTEKHAPAAASGRLIWEEKAGGRSEVRIAPFPNLLPVFENQNTVAVTDDMASRLGKASGLLRLLHDQAGVAALTRYPDLVPLPRPETLALEEARLVGSDFDLAAGGFLWVKFAETNLLELGEAECRPLRLAAGVNAFGYTCFPDRYSAYRLVRELGLERVRALRALDSSSGRWRSALVENGKLVGEDFEVPRIAVLILDLKTPIDSWKPGE